MTDQGFFYTPNYHYLPKWVEDHEKSTLLQEVKIINYRTKNNDSDNLKHILHSLISSI